MLKKDSTTLTRHIKYLLPGLTICFFQLTALGQQNKNIDSLLSLVKTDKEDTNKVNHLNTLSREYINTGNFDSALYYSNTTLQLAEQLNFKKGRATSFSNIGIIYKSQGNYPQALDYYFKALKLVPGENERTVDDKKRAASIFGNIGTVYTEQGDYPKALGYYFKALKMAEELANKNGIAITMGNIGNVYSDQKDYSKGLDYYFKALKLDEELGDKNGVQRHLINIGIVYDEQGNYSKALDYYLKALKINEEQNNKIGIAKALGNIGIVYRNQGDYSKALDYYFRALKLDEELGDKRSVAINQSNIGVLYTDTKKYVEAEKYLLDAGKMFKEIGAMNEERQVEEALSDLYSKTNRYSNALEHYKNAIVLKDSIFNQENKKQLVRKEMNFEFDKKEAVANAVHKKELENQQAVADEKNRKQNIITWSVVVGLLLVVTFAGFIFRSLRITRKQKEIIEVQKTEVEKSKHIIEEKNKDITDSIIYAKRIQQAKLPDRKEIHKALPNSFVLFKPKDIVSGDFYYFHKNDKSIFIASADCTGHGVPGAFMSMIGSEKLDDAVSQSADTSEILRQLNKGIKNSLHQSDSDESTRDGMDIALCSVDKVHRIVKYAGANRPLWIIRNGQTAVEEIKGTKNAIGGLTEDSQHFDSHEIKFEQGDTFYISTDGYADTFGGNEQKKVTTKRFKEILLSIQDKSMQEQERHLDNFIENWKSGTEQVDDILVIGVRL